MKNILAYRIGYMSRSIIAEARTFFFYKTLEMSQESIGIPRYVDEAYIQSKVEIPQ